VSIEILESRVVLPAFIFYKENGVEKEAFIYIDQLAGDVIIPDPDMEDVAEFKEKILKHMKIGFTPVKVPPMPKEGFKKLNPEDYLNEEF